MHHHWSPPCETFCCAAVGTRCRTIEDPEGHPPPGTVYATKVEEHTQIAKHTCRLARTAHEVGDFFSVEQPDKSTMFYLDCYKELAGLPGVFKVTFDNCEYGEEYKHRQVILTNAPWLVKLSRDCAQDHRHALLGFGGDLPTKAAASFSTEMCRVWAKAFADYVDTPECYCPFCADAAGVRAVPDSAKEKKFYS